MVNSRILESDKKPMKFSMHIVFDQKLCKDRCLATFDKMEAIADVKCRYYMRANGLCDECPDRK